ncbi:type II toxin-antitoxin system VapC family toxin [Jatrophihabitans sp.]|uniref:type II toxin-antitoxin system VapC family toxin n=1 Tax=Jatrophihabitans sp. TaxID=1932789 RepID=UPI002EEC4945
MSPAVVDASVLAVFYLTEDRRRDAVVVRLTAGDAMYAPAHLDTEVVSALRGLARGNPALRRVVPAVLRHLAGLPVQRMPLAPLLERMWALRENVTAYDAAYVALAERLTATVTTCDAKLAAASGTRCAFDLIS